MTTDTPSTAAPATDPLAQKQHYLDLLAIFHYVVAGLAAFFSLFAVMYVVLGGVMLFNPEAMADGGNAPPAFIGCFILGLGLVGLLAAWVYAGCLVYAGRCLAKRRRFTFCLVMAAVSCMFTPFGTVLGILTIILLVQPEVRALFANGVAKA